MRRLVQIVYPVVVASGVVGLALSAAALPFNDDMVDIQLKAGQIMREQPADSVPLGSVDHRIESIQAAETMQNPYKDDPHSVRNGTRLWQTNCFPCHGDPAKTPWTPGPVPVPGPNVTAELYRSYSDGKLFGTVHFGTTWRYGLMPRYGYRLTERERWDIVSYVRHVQNAAAQAGR